MKLKHARCLLTCLIIFVFVVAFSVFSSTCCLAREAPTRGRVIYNNFMLIVNFGILVFLFLKYGKKPLLDFLNNERKKTEKQLNQLNSQFESAKQAMNDEAAKLDNIMEYIETMRKDILEIAKREKEKIIEDAKRTAAKMIKDAEAYSVYQMVKAKKTLSNELVDIAVSVVEEKLKKGITEKDNEVLINRFLTGVEASKNLLERPSI